MNIEYTDDPHPRNTYWEMWGQPMFDLKDPAGVMYELDECRKVFGNRYIRVSAFDSPPGWESLRLSFIVHRPEDEPGFTLERHETRGPPCQYTLRRLCHRASRSASATEFVPASLTLGPPASARRPTFRSEDEDDASASRRPSGTQSTCSGLRGVRASREVLEQLDRELVGLAPVKRRIREIAALLLVDKLRSDLGLTSATPTLHMSFTGNPGTGKTTVALRMADILHRLGYIRSNHLVSVTRDDLVGQYIGHTAPKTKEILKKAMGGVLFIDEAYYLYRPENERDYGQEAIEILLQVMENRRDDLVVILAGYADRMDRFFASNPGLPLAHRAPRRLPGLYARTSCSTIAELMLAEQSYRFSPAAARGASATTSRQRMHAAAFRQRALDPQRARPRPPAPGDAAVREPRPALSADDLMTIEAEEIRASRVFAGGIERRAAEHEP